MFSHGGVPGVTYLHKAHGIPQPFVADILFNKYIQPLCLLHLHRVVAPPPASSDASGVSTKVAS